MLTPPSLARAVAAARARVCLPLASVAAAHAHGGGGGGAGNGGHEAPPRRWRAAFALGAAVAGAGAAAYAHSAAAEAVGGGGGSAPGSEADRLLRGALDRLRSDPGCVSVDEAQGFLRPLLSAVRRAYGIPPPGRVPPAIFSADDPAPRPPSVLLMLLPGDIGGGGGTGASTSSSPGASAARRRGGGSGGGDEAAAAGEVIFRGRLGEMHQPPAAAAAAGGADDDGGQQQPPGQADRRPRRRHGKEPYAYLLLLHLQEAYPQAVGALLKEPGDDAAAASASPMAAHPDALSAPPVLPLDGDGVLRLPIPSGQLVIDVGAAPDVEVRWRVHRRRATAGGESADARGVGDGGGRVAGSAAPVASTSSSGGSGLTYADLDAVASVFSLGAVAYAHAKHDAAEARAAAQPDGAAGAPGRAKAFLHAQAERQETLAGVREYRWRRRRARVGVRLRRTRRHSNSAASCIPPACLPPPPREPQCPACRCCCG
jgi:hypothetical protein